MKLHSMKAAALAGVLGGIALAGTGVAHALDGEPPLNCSQDAHGNTVCRQNIKRTWTTDEGTKVVVKQTMDCTSAQRSRQYGPDAEAPGKDGHQGAHIDCSPTAPR